MANNESIADIFASFFPNTLARQIISLLLIHEKLSLLEIHKLIKNYPALSEHDIIRKLTSLEKENWIITNVDSSKITTYSLNSFDVFKEILDEIIDKTQNRLTQQKHDYYYILQLLRTQNESKSIPEIFAQYNKEVFPERFPIFIKPLFFQLQKSLSNPKIKFEKSNLLLFPLEKLSFRLHSFQFDYTQNESQEVGQIFFCEMIDQPKDVRIYERIHRYHRENLSVQFKLEQGGYYENRMRNLVNFQQSQEEIIEQTHEIASEFHLTFQTYEKKGNLYTYNALLKETYVYSFYTENQTLTHLLRDFIKTLSTKQHPLSS